jgi:organic hydroperoxide reductase OsmC/OhrA
MSVLKDFRFRVEVEGSADPSVEVTTEEGLALDVATPPEFRGGMHGDWSPEHLFLASVGTCYALTLAGVAERRQIPLGDVGVTGVLHVTRRADGRFGFVVVELAVRVTTEEGFEDDARRAARAAEARCLVARALDIPVEVELEVSTAVPVPA